MVLMLIAHKCKRHSGEQKSVFKKLDADCDGKLSKNDLAKALMQMPESKYENE